MLIRCVYNRSDFRRSGAFRSHIGLSGTWGVCSGCLTEAVRRNHELQRWDIKTRIRYSVLKSAIALMGADNFIADGGKGEGLPNSVSSGCPPTTDGTNRLSSFVPGDPTLSGSAQPSAPPLPSCGGGARGVMAAAVLAEFAAPRADPPPPPACQVGPAPTAAPGTAPAGAQRHCQPRYSCLCRYYRDCPGRFWAWP